MLINTDTFDSAGSPDRWLRVSEAQSYGSGEGGRTIRSVWGDRKPDSNTCLRSERRTKLCKIKICRHVSFLALGFFPPLAY